MFFYYIDPIIAGSVSSLRRGISSVTISAKLFPNIPVAGVTRRRVGARSVGIFSVTATRRRQSSHQPRAMLVAGRQSPQLSHRLRRRVDLRVPGPLGRPQVLRRPARALRDAGAVSVSALLGRALWSTVRVLGSGD